MAQGQEYPSRPVEGMLSSRESDKVGLCRARPRYLFAADVGCDRLRKPPSITKMSWGDRLQLFAVYHEDGT